MNLYPWQEAPWDQLQEARRLQRLPHAILLTGPEGGGKSHFARAFAHGLLCEQPQEKGLACGHCSACHLLAAESHPDLKKIEPEAVGKAIKVDTIREFLSKEYLSSQMGGHKIWIISPAHAMNAASANALLKTLEEPTTGSLMILISANPLLLPATIRSRCQAMRFPLPGTKDALAWLTQQGEADWPSLLAMAAGSPLKALNLATEEAFQERQTITTQAFELLSGKADPIMTAKAWSEEDADRLTHSLLSLLIDLGQLSQVPQAERLFNPNHRDQLMSLSRTRSARYWQQLISEVLRLRKNLTRQLNLQLQLETLSTNFTESSLINRSL
jgi:DNA polymerase-3 subunit delta'